MDISVFEVREEMERLIKLTKSGILSSEVRNQVIKDMNKKKEEFVFRKHTNTICKIKDGRFKTKNPQMTAKTREKLIDKLYDYYYSNILDTATLADIYELWIAERRENKTLHPETIRHNEIDWKKHISTSSLATMLFTDIKASNISCFFKEKAATGKITRKKLGNFKDVLNGIYDYAYEHDLCDHNISRPIQIRNIKCIYKDNSKELYDFQKERPLILDYLEKQTYATNSLGVVSEIYDLAIQLMFCLNIRFGEISSLQWSDYRCIDGKYYISINKQVIKDANNGSTSYKVVGYTKAQNEKGSRTLPIFERAQKILERLYVLTGTKEYMFQLREKDFLNNKTINEHLKKICKALDIEYHSTHKIRFGAVSEAFKQNQNPLLIQRTAGHLQSSTTQHYNRAQDIIEAGYDSLQAVFN